MDPQSTPPSQQTPPPQQPPMPGQQPPQQLPAHKNTLMAVLAYLGILILIPFLMTKDDPFVKFHIKQGAILVVAELVIWAFGSMMIGSPIWPILSLVNLGTLILAIFGIVNVIKGEEKELPLVGHLAHNFHF